MTLQIGTILIAKEDRNFPNGSSITKGKEYKIEDNLDGHYYIKTDNITSVFRRNRIDDYFTIKRYTLSDLQERKIAVRIQWEEEYIKINDLIGSKTNFRSYYKNSGLNEKVYYRLDAFGRLCYLDDEELKDFILLESIDLIDLEVKEEVVNECEISPLYVDKLESEITRLKGDNEMLKSDLGIMVSQFEILQLRESPQISQNLTKRERMAWELIIKNGYFYQGQPRTVPGSDHHHHGSLHQQDAASERCEKAAYRGRGLEGSFFGEHG
jgi:hypothetical protein